MNIENKLAEYEKKGIYPMHMPGHKRNFRIMNMENPYLIDVTETGELDNLHEPSGMIKEAMDRAALLYGSDRTYYLVNGSTCGLMAGICAAAQKGGKILMGRNCHKSVYNGVCLRELEPVYIYPEIDEEFGVYGSISPESVEKKLEDDPEIQLTVITSPTYEGVVSDIKSISEICHSHGVPLLVDAAHGAHFGFSTYFPQRAVLLGADMSVESVHKTLPAFTQTSIMHFKSDIVVEEKLRHQLSVFQSTSPSYILMSGIDKCMELLSEDEEKGYFKEYEARLKKFESCVKTLNHIRILCKGRDSLAGHPGIYAFDPGKIVISVKGTGINGAGLEAILLNEYRIQLEMSLLDYGIAMTSICDTDEGFDRLAAALLAMDRRMDRYEPVGASETGVREKPEIGAGEIKTEMKLETQIAEALPADMKPAAAVEADVELVGVEDCAGRISGEYIYAYPPGIPLIVPGERISRTAIGYLKHLTAQGNNVYSTCKGWPEKISVVKK